MNERLTGGFSVQRGSYHTCELCVKSLCSVSKVKFITEYSNCISTINKQYSNVAVLKFLGHHNDIQLL